MQDTAWVQVLVGAAAAISIIGAIFGYANKFIVAKIGRELDTRFDSFEKTLIKTLKEGYVGRSEYAVMEEFAKGIHERHDRGIDQLWKAINGKPR